MGREQTPAEAKRAMLEWVDSNAEALMQACRTMADLNRDNAISAAARSYPASVRAMLHEHADRWAALGTELSALYEVLPSRDDF
jgi:hypothetical protein